MKKWIALFSQTGSEIKNLTEKLGFRPDKVFTNNKNTNQWINNIKGTNIIVESHDELMKELDLFDSDKYFITLHGYLRIIPEHLCSKFEIYNGHPGLITRYPQLKGFNPQERITSEMEVMGSVCHRVTPIVDDGEIISEKVVDLSMEDVYNKLKETSLEAWLDLFDQMKRGDL